MGVLGGAFNPPHLGHLVAAQEAAWELGLSEVLFVPTGQAPHKEIAGDPGSEIRVEMTRLATEGDERFQVSLLEVEREGPSYTYETLEALAGERPDHELELIVGSDAAVDLESWRNPERVIELARLAIAGRPGVGIGVVKSVLQHLGAAGRADFLVIPEVPVSSTMVRKRVAAGKPIRYLVPDRVAELIEERGLYAG